MVASKIPVECEPNTALFVCNVVKTNIMMAKSAEIATPQRTRFLPEELNTFDVITSTFGIFTRSAVYEVYQIVYVIYVTPLAPYLPTCRFGDNHGGIGTVPSSVKE